MDSEHGGCGTHRQEIRHRLRQKDRKSLIRKKVGQNINEGNQQDDLPQHCQEQGDLGVAQGQAIWMPKIPVAAM